MVDLCMSQLLFSIPETSFLFQERPFYSGNLNSEMPGDIQNTFLRLGDVLAVFISVGNRAKTVQ